jgi:predicted transcriptional regulator
MEASAALRRARSDAGLSQRALARRADVPQPAIARIEQGRVTPRVDTLTHLLAACGRELTLTSRPGQGIDRTVIRRLLKLTPLQRLELAVTEATNMDELLAKIEK